MLAVASAWDLRVRRVPNRVWTGSAVVALMLVAVDWVHDDVSWVDVVFVPLLVAVFFLLWRIRLIAGGADAKALMVLALLVPASVAVDVPGVTLPLWPSLVPPAFSILGNSVLAF